MRSLFSSPIKIATYAKNPCSCEWIACLEKPPNKEGIKATQEENIAYTKKIGLKIIENGMSHKDAGIRFLVQNNLVEITINLEENENVETV